MREDLNPASLEPSKGPTELLPTNTLMGALINAYTALSVRDHTLLKTVGMFNCISSYFKHFSSANGASSRVKVTKHS